MQAFADLLYTLLAGYDLTLLLVCMLRFTVLCSV